MKNEEIEIVEQAVKKIVILSSTYFSLEEFMQRVELIAKAGQPMVLNWVEGITFYFMPYHPNSDIIIEEALRGTYYWSVVVFASMPKYEPIKRFGAREIPIINQSSEPHLTQVAQWLKKKIKQ